MSKHAQVQELLYEYLQNELPETDRATVEKHLQSCAQCNAELNDLKDTIAMVPASALDASKQRSEEYWKNFAFSVQGRLNDPRPMKKRPLLSLSDMLDHMFFTPRPYVTAFASAMVILIAALVVFRWYDHKEAVERELAENVSRQEAQYDSTTAKVYRYVKESKMVLVGISNMKPVSGATYDISVEQQKSRQLVHQARYLENQPLDDRTAKLVSDLQKILIELANMKEQGNAPNVDIIRGGMHDENILFKIRMAEDTYNPNRDQRNSF